MSEKKKNVLNFDEVCIEENEFILEGKTYRVKVLSVAEQNKVRKLMREFQETDSDDRTVEILKETIQIYCPGVSKVTLDKMAWKKLIMLQQYVMSEGDKIPDIPTFAKQGKGEGSKN